MTRKLALLFLLAALPLTGCDKVRDKVPFLKKKPVATPAPAVVNVPAATPPPAPAEPPAPARPTVDTNAEVVVLCYHRLEGKAGGALSIEPAVFEQQMQQIKDSGIPVIGMQDFLAWRRGEKNIPPKSIIITIDDGYVSSYSVGWPILKKFGYPFTMYVYLSYIGIGGKSITWQQLAEMRDAGVDIGSHSVLHADMKFKPRRLTGSQIPMTSTVMPMDYDTWLKFELEHSKAVIEEKLGIKCNTFAYPFGLHNEKVREAAKAAGYEAAFTTYGARLGVSTPAMSLGRYDVTTKDAQGVDSFTVGLSFKGMAAPAGESPMVQEAATSMITEPMNNATTTDPTPLIKANLSTMGALDAATVEMRISSLGLVPAKFDPASKMIQYQVDKPLRAGFYTVIITAQTRGQRRETRWTFHFNPSGETAPENPVPAAPAPRPAKKPGSR